MYNTFIIQLLDKMIEIFLQTFFLYFYVDEVSTYFSNLVGIDDDATTFVSYQLDRVYDLLQDSFNDIQHFGEVDDVFNQSVFDENFIKPIQSIVDDSIHYMFDDINYNTNMFELYQIFIHKMCILVHTNKSDDIHTARALWNARDQLFKLTNGNRRLTNLANDIECHIKSVVALATARLAICTPPTPTNGI